MSSWAEVGHVLANGGPIGVPTSALLFDTSSELLWTGSALGNVASHYGPGLQRYTSWQAHVAGNGNSSTNPGGGVKGILCDERAVYSVGDNGIKAAIRRGTGRWNMFSAQSDVPSLHLASMCFSPSASSDILAAGASASAIATGHVGKDDMVLALNSGTGSIIRRAASEAQIILMRRASKYVCAGSIDGHIQLRDPRSLQIEHRLHAHPGGLVDMQADGHQLYSVGWTVRLGHPVPEPIVKVHDLRMMRALVPIPFSATGGPALLTVHPKRSSTVIVAAPSGQFQIVDVGNLGEATFHQVSVSSYLTSMSMSPSANFLAFGEADGSVRLWASSNEASQFTSYSSQSVDMPDVPETPPEPINWTTESSLSNVGLPYYDELLLSAMPHDEYTSSASPLFNPPKKIDPTVLNSIRTVDKVSYAPLPRHLRGKRNEITAAGPNGMSAGAAARTQDKRRPEERRRIGAPMFRSEREAAKRQANNGAPVDEVPLSPGIEIGTSSMPAHYHIKTIEYSKFGVEDFDFEFYNKTRYSGLETHIENSYANAYLQAMHYLLPFRAVAESHAMTSVPLDPSQGGCQKDDCLLCQAGFLSKMLQDAKGANCQATNFLRALSSSERAAALGLMDKEDSPNANAAYSSLIQTFNRFMLETTTSEAYNAAKHGHHNDDAAVQVLSKLFTCAQVTKHACATCGRITIRESNANVVDLLYPRKALSNELAPPSDFASILRASLMRETLSKSTCRSCHTSAATFRSRRILPPNGSLPQALSVNCAVNTAEQLRYWITPPPTSSSNVSESTRSYLPAKIAIDVQGDDVQVNELRTEEAHNRAIDEGRAVYVLRSMVVQVQADKDLPHLVALVNVRDREGDGDGDGDGDESWHLFNDFLVRRVPEDEALRFPAPWKVPAVLIWERVDRTVVNLDALPYTADVRLLCRDITISEHRDAHLQRHLPLLDDELATLAGTIVAIDSEFVALNQEELELSSTGTRRLIRPSRLSLARVSVLRGEGEREGEAFVDDFIWTKDPVVDYLTRFSGIKPGDLEPHTSRHTLVPHRLAYKKLRMLVDNGCRFLGHGLTKDFRIINMYVPPAQVIDTVDLFQSSSHPRKLSLRFLTWFLLKEDIQGPHANEAAIADGSAPPPSSSSSADGHDSIEDALAALKLYRLYLTFVRDNRLEDVLEDLYDAGRVHGWKPPNRALTAGAVPGAVA